LLRDAKTIADRPASAPEFSLGRLQLMKDACERYSLGTVQRLVKQQVDRARNDNVVS